MKLKSRPRLDGMSYEEEVLKRDNVRLFINLEINLDLIKRLKRQNKIIKREILSNLDRQFILEDTVKENI